MPAWLPSAAGSKSKAIWLDVEDGFKRFGVLGKSIWRLEDLNGFNGVLVEKYLSAGGNSDGDPLFEAELKSEAWWGSIGKAADAGGVEGGEVSRGGGDGVALSLGGGGVVYPGGGGGGGEGLHWGGGVLRKKLISGKSVLKTRDVSLYVWGALQLGLLDPSKVLVVWKRNFSFV